MQIKISDLNGKFDGQEDRLLLPYIFPIHNNIDH